MNKKTTSIGLTSFLIGICVYGSTLFLQKKNEQNFQKQRNEITSKLIKIGRPVVDENNVDYFADYASKENEQLIAKQEKQQQKANLLLTVSILCIVAGSTIIAFMLSIEIARLIASNFSAWIKFITKYFGHDT